MLCKRRAAKRTSSETTLSSAAPHQKGRVKNETSAWPVTAFVLRRCTSFCIFSEMQMPIDAQKTSAKPIKSLRILSMRGSMGTPEPYSPAQPGPANRSAPAASILGGSVVPAIAVHAAQAVFLRVQFVLAL